MTAGPSLLPRFARAGRHSEFSVALLISEVVAPHADLAGFRASFDEFVRPWAEGGVRDAQGLLGEFRAQGFGGNPVGEADFRHSDLAAVFSTREGIPISLGVLLIEAARRCGLVAHGVNFPGHFLVEIEGELVDPLGMRIVAAADIDSGGADVDSLLQPATPLMVALRMLNNVKALFLAHGDLHRALEIIDYQIALDPDSKASVASFLFEQGEVWQRLGAYTAARQAFERCADLSPFVRLTEKARERAGKLSERDETWH